MKTNGILYLLAGAVVGYWLFKRKPLAVKQQPSVTVNGVPETPQEQTAGKKPAPKKIPPRTAKPPVVI